MIVSKWQKFCHFDTFSAILTVFSKKGGRVWSIYDEQKSTEKRS